MYSLSHIRRRIEALERKFAVELAIVKLRPLADEYCDQWTELVDEKLPPPDPHRLIKRLVNAGIRLDNFPAVRKYLDNCRRDHDLPHPNQILRALLPMAAARCLVPRPLQTVSY